MAHAAPAEYVRHGRYLLDNSYGRDLLDSSHIDYVTRGLEPSSAHIRSPAGLLHEYTSAYRRPLPVRLMNDRSLLPPYNFGLDMALPERLAAIELAQPAKPWTTSVQTKDRIVHVIEAAETAVRDHASALLDKEQENEHLRSILRIRDRETRNSKIEHNIGARLVERRDNHSGHKSPQTGAFSALDRHWQFPGVDHATANGELWTGNDFTVDPQCSSIVRPNPQLHSEKNIQQFSNGLQGQHFAPTHGVNAALRSLNHTQGGTFSQMSFPTSSSMSPIRTRDLVVLTM